MRSAQQGQSYLLQGHVYVTGLGDSGQLGLGCRKAIAQDATLISFPYEDYTIVQITAGIAHNSMCIYPDIKQLYSLMFLH